MSELNIIHGDALVELAKLPAESAHLIVTSPPYWGLRDYKIPPSIWGGDAACKHPEWGDEILVYATNHVDKRRWNHARNGRGEDQPKEKRPGWKRQHIGQGQFCQKCNAWRGCFGLEPTPELYIQHSVLIFREAMRVLRDDGTLWVNLGDSYAAGGGDRRDHGNGFNSCVGRTADAAMPRSGRVEQSRHFKAVGLKPGDLVGIPWRVALALQADGWYLRRDNIWFKPNPMPESVNGWRWEQHRIKVAHGKATQHKPSGWDTSNGTHAGVAKGRHGSEEEASFEPCPGCDKCTPNGGLVLRKGNWRCTTSHEYVFQFSKSHSYFCDAEAAREKTTGNAHARGHGVNPKAKTPEKNSRIHVDRDVAHATSAKRPRQNESFSAAVAGLVGNRNRRSVWQIATAPYRDAHFATFPPALVRPIIAAASPVQCCAECAAPYAPVVERGEPNREQQAACGGNGNGEYHGSATKDFAGARAENASEVKARILAGMVEKKVIGYRPTCTCGAASKPAMVLDMFGGSGTVGQVSRELGRSCTIIEISEAYIPLIHQRTAVTPGLAL